MRYAITIITLLMSFSSYTMGEGGRPDIKIVNKKIQIDRSDFVDAQDRNGDVYILDQLSNNEVTTTQNFVVIDPSKSDLVDVQLQDGRIIVLDKLKAVDPGNGGAGGGGF